jgi:Ser/Thr protein kinase RdoA (MazF antagonist)
MLKLRHLFNNPALAEMLVKNWQYDPDALELFQYFRISANAIYPLKIAGEWHFLRVSPASEKSRDSLLAELDFIQYLRGAQYHAPEPVFSQQGEMLVQKTTPWGEYFACVFRTVTGKQISQTGLADEIVYAYGAALGQLHQLSTHYTSPGTRRWSHLEVFNWIETTLHELCAGPLPFQELGILQAFFSRLPITPANYGLIHYDFDTDNVFYDPAAQTCNVIDFDDAMYHWYMMDIERALNSLIGETSSGAAPLVQDRFLQGYRSQFTLDPVLFSCLPVFNRFARLYRYTRTMRSISEQWQHEPEWMVDLRAHLNQETAHDAAYFGFDPPL